MKIKQKIAYILLSSIFFSALFVEEKTLFANTRSDMVIHNAPEYYKGRLLVYMEKAVTIALDDADVPYANAYILNRSFTYELGTIVYHIIFNDEYNPYQYFYNIDAMDGRIISSEIRLIGDDSSFKVVKSKSNLDYNYISSIAVSNEYIDIETICNQLNIIVPGSTRSDIDIKEIYEENRKYYKGSIFYEGVVYDFKIDAVDGLIVEWDKSYGPEMGVFHIDEVDIYEYLDRKNN